MRTMESIRPDLPELKTPLPGPNAKALIQRDSAVISPSYTRTYPLVAARGRAPSIEDVDGNRFLDFNAGIAVVFDRALPPARGSSHPGTGRRLIHMSGTDFYYENMVALAETLAPACAGGWTAAIYFGNSGAEAMEGRSKLARYIPDETQFIAFLGCFHGRTMGALSLTARRAVQRRGFGPMMPGVASCPLSELLSLPVSARRRIIARWSAPSISRISLLKTIAPAEDVAAIVDRAGAGRRRLYRPAAKILR